MNDLEFEAIISGLENENEIVDALFYIMENEDHLTRIVNNRRVVDIIFGILHPSSICNGSHMFEALTVITL